MAFIMNITGIKLDTEELEAGQRKLEAADPQKFEAVQLVIRMADPTQTELIDVLAEGLKKKPNYDLKATISAGKTEERGVRIIWTDIYPIHLREIILFLEHRDEQLSSKVLALLERAVDKLGKEDLDAFMSNFVGYGFGNNCDRLFARVIRRFNDLERPDVSRTVTPPKGVPPTSTTPGGPKKIVH